MGGEQRVRLYGQERLKVAGIFLETKFSHAMDIRQEGKTGKVKFHHRPGDLEMACEKVSFLSDICNRRYFFYSVSYLKASVEVTRGLLKLWAIG